MDLSAKRISKSMWCLLGIILFIILFSLISPYLAPNDPYLTHSDNILAAPDMNHLFGTDNHGRDVLSRVMVGSRSSIFAAFAIIACAGTLGSFVGLMGGYFGGKVDACLMRVTDIFLAFPDILLAIAVAGILGGSLLNAMFALVLTAWTQYARLARSSTIAIKEETFIHAARLGGCSDREIIFLHILPNIAESLIVTATLHVSGMMMGLAGLSFLGLGVQVPEAEWGSMISEGRYCLQNAPWVALAPSAVMVSVMLVLIYSVTRSEIYWIRKMKNNYIFRRKNMKKRWIAAGLAAVTACSVLSAAAVMIRKRRRIKSSVWRGQYPYLLRPWIRQKDGMAGTLSATVSARHCLK